MLSWLLALVLHLAPPAQAGVPACLNPAGSLPRPTLNEGTRDRSIPIEHIFIIIQENHAFDNYFGRLNAPEYYGSEVDGIDPSMWNPDSLGQKERVVLEDAPCSINPDHSWNAAHLAWDQGKNDGFWKANVHAKGGAANIALHYYDDRFLGFYYALANEFTIGDRYFSSVLGPTIPNRMYSMAATSFGHISNLQRVKLPHQKHQTIFDLLDRNHISWRYYISDLPYIGLMPRALVANVRRIAPVSRLRNDLAKKDFPTVVFIDPSMLVDDEHPPHDIQLGQHSVAKHVRDLIESPYWESSALFLTYDENGGFFDHVPPPEACAPDDIPPKLKPSDLPGGFDRLGFRVPFVLVSPYARRHYVSHSVYDHTSLLRFIETWQNLPALTRRDANANPMLDLFDFDHPDYRRPTLPDAAVDRKLEIECLLRHPERGFPDDGRRR